MSLNQSRKPLQNSDETGKTLPALFPATFPGRVSGLCDRITHDMPRRLHLTLLALLLGTAACAAVQPVNPGGPRRNEPVYPVLLTDNQQRRDEGGAALAQFTQQGSSETNSAMALLPVTATIRSLPVGLKTPLYLPRVGTGKDMNEEETREALRRFLNQWQKLLGAKPAQLSLAQQTREADGLNLVVYEQRPFSYLLRGPYGRIEVRFANDGRIIALSSTAIPDADKIQTALGASASRLKSEVVTTKLTGRKVDYTDQSGTKRSFIIGSAGQINFQQVVVYPILSTTRPDTLEFHFAWEVNLSEAPVKTIYYDALQDEVLAAS